MIFIKISLIILIFVLIIICNKFSDKLSYYWNRDFNDTEIQYKVL